MTILSPTYPPPAFPMTKRDLAGITTFVVHHSAGPLSQTAEQIDAEHRAIGDSMLAYEWVVVPNGTVYVGRSPEYVPAATYGLNTQSLNVCLIGNFEKGDPGFTGPPSSAQMESLRDLSIRVHQRFPTVVRTVGHRDVAGLFYGGDSSYSTACPGKLLYDLLPQLRRDVAAKLHLK